MARKGWKLRLVWLMYRRGLAREDILELFRVIDSSLIRRGRRWPRGFKGRSRRNWNGGWSGF